MTKKLTKNTKTVIALIVLALLLVIVPFALNAGADFGGSDDAGSAMVSQIQGEEYQPWFEPILETAIGGELPGEMESLLFCVQTGIGVGILAFGFGYLVARKKYKGNPEQG